MPNKTKETFPWPKAALALRRRVGAGCIHPKVRALLQRHETSRILVACSGGADSIFMLCLLWAYAEDLGLKLIVAHYNHRWRGEASDGDAEFVMGMAHGLSCPFVSDVRPAHEAAFTETTARELRLSFLRRAAREHECGWIAFGHQKDDILETQLQRLARGCGSDGLAAPRPVSLFDKNPTHLRPLLHLRAGDIRMALNVCGIPWREDSSNTEVEIPRNALRHRVIPDLMQALCRDPSAGASRSRQLLEEDAEALDIVAREQLSAAFSGKAVLLRSELRAAPRGITRRGLAAWLSAHDLIQSVSAPAMELLLDAVYSRKLKDCFSAGTAFIVLDGTRIRVEYSRDSEPALPPDAVVIEPGESVILLTGALLETEVLELDATLRKGIFRGEVDPRREAFIAYKDEEILKVRGWQPGDRFHPLGAPGTKKLKDWFIDRHIPQWERKRLPVVTTAKDEIVWVPGFPPAEVSKIRPATKLALRLTYNIRNSL